MRLEVSREVAAPRVVVWEVLTRWEQQPDWMLDAESVEVLTPVRQGVGVTLRCPTGLLGLTVDDVMRVDEWSPPARLGVVHLGPVVVGRGVFELESLGGARTRVRWLEEIEPPLGRLGAWGAQHLARPLLARVFAGSLGRLAALAEGEAAGTGGEQG